jgi:hypothetical protein
MAFTDVDLSQQYALGTRAREKGTGREFVYLKGAANVAVGSVVVYDEVGAVALADSDTPTIGPVAIAVSAVDATTKFGWFGIVGRFPAKVLAAFADEKQVYMTSTGGSVDDSGAGAEVAVLNAVSRSAIDTPTTGQAYLQVNYPFIVGATFD